MQSNIHIVDTAESCHIDIEGTIGVPEEWQFEDPEERVATYDKFRNTLQRIAEIQAPEVVVNIRSTGGDVNDALLIHDALCALDAHITTRCYGYTASAATIIAQAASEGCREISANALYLIHSSICSVEGNSSEIADYLDLLRQTDARIAGVYAARSGCPVEQFESLMAENDGRGRWLSPAEAMEAGLADRIIESTDRSATRPKTDNRAEVAEGADVSANELPTDTATAESTTVTARTDRWLSGWKRLLVACGFLPSDGTAQRTASASTQEEVPEAECNVLHGSHPLASLRRSQIASEESRRQFGPTEVSQREDPSYGETLRSANERAYASDARAFR